MHDIEPYYNWRHIYIASDDERSPMSGKANSEIEFTHSIYNHWIHPQWDFIGSSTLFIKILYANYDSGFTIIELFGEWNDVLHNDIMYLIRDIAEPMLKEGINKFILIGENVLNFHSGDNDYYQEWYDEIGDGWVVGLNFREHIIKEFIDANLDYYIAFGGRFNAFAWRKADPIQLFSIIDELITKRLNP